MYAYIGHVKLFPRCYRKFLLCHLFAVPGHWGEVRGPPPFDGCRAAHERGRSGAVATVFSTSAVRKWESCEADGFVFVWYHADDERPSWRPAAADGATRGWTYRGRSEHYVNAHVQDIPENGADVSHLSALHGDMALGGQYAAQANRSPWNVLGLHKWQAAWKADGDGGRRHVATLDLKHELELFGRFVVFKMDVKAHQASGRRARGDDIMVGRKPGSGKVRRSRPAFSKSRCSQVVDACHSRADIRRVLRRFLTNGQSLN